MKNKETIPKYYDAFDIFEIEDDGDDAAAQILKEIHCTRILSIDNCIQRLVHGEADMLEKK